MAEKHRETQREKQGEKQRETPNPIQVQKFLGGLDYPVGKRDILDKAKREGADEKVMKALEKLPDEEYSSPVQVSREVGKLD